MVYQVFYFFEGTGESVPSTQPREMTARAIGERLLDQLRGPDDYIGLLDTEARVLQILRVGEGFRIELPLDAAKASYERMLSPAEMRAFLQALPESFERDQIPGLRYRPW